MLEGPPENFQVSSSGQKKLTDRQNREVEYHKEHTRKHRGDILATQITYDVVYSTKRRWWNATWSMYSFLLQKRLSGKRVLVVGCGFGIDALCLSKIGADVYAFDLSQDSLAVARLLAEREQLSVSWNEMPAESLQYESDTFDCVFIRDILHHVDIPRTMNEIQRVCKEGAWFIASEVYTHSLADRVRHSALVEKTLYPKMRNFIHRGSVYITEDECKLNEDDVHQIDQAFDGPTVKKYFGCIVDRLLPNKFPFFAKIDRLLLMALKPLAPLLGGRVLIAGRLKK